MNTMRHTLPMLVSVALLSAMPRPSAPAGPASKPSATWNFTFPNRTAGASPTFDEVLASARASKRPVLIDFSADWCGACRLLDRNTYTAAEVIQQMKRFVTIRIDATNSDEVVAYTKRFGVSGLPTMDFVSSSAAVLSESTIIGFVDGPTLVRRMREIR